MKKIAIILTLGLVLQIIPVKSFAGEAPTNALKGGAIAALVTTFLIITDEDSAGKKEAKATGNEFTDLNNKPGFSVLLKQMAGGSLNTVEILK